MSVVGKIIRNKQWLKQCSHYELMLFRSMEEQGLFDTELLKIAEYF